MQQEADLVDRNRPDDGQRGSGWQWRLGRMNDAPGAAPYKKEKKAPKPRIARSERGSLGLI